MAASDLAQLTDVKTWIAGSSSIGTPNDALLSRLITDISGAIYAYLSRPWLIPRTITERYDGGGKRRLYLRRFPVVSIVSLMIDGVAIPAAPLPAAGQTWPQSGYLLDPWDGAPPGVIQGLDLYGCYVLGQSFHSFHHGRQNVQVTYTAGYQISGEAATVPTGANPSVTPQAPYGPWASDAGVTYANGTALTKVASAPAQGQYCITGSMTYGFNTADASAGVLISYGFIPAAISNACIEWVAERFRYQNRIGQSSQTVSGQMTSAYSLKGVPDFIKASLDPYRHVVPM